MEDLDTTIEKLPNTEYIVSGVFNSRQSLFRIYKYEAGNLEGLYTSDKGVGCKEI